MASRGLGESSPDGWIEVGHSSKLLHRGACHECDVLNVKSTDQCQGCLLLGSVLFAVSRKFRTCSSASMIARTRRREIAAFAPDDADRAWSCETRTGADI